MNDTCFSPLCNIQTKEKSNKPILYVFLTVVFFFLAQGF